MISGSQKAQQKAKPLLVATSEKVFEFGKSVGAGSAMKSVNQMLAAFIFQQWQKQLHLESLKA